MKHSLRKGILHNEIRCPGELSKKIKSRGRTFAAETSFCGIVVTQWRIQKSLVGDVVEWPTSRVAEGGGLWGGGTPSPRGGVWGGGCAPSPEFFFHFAPQNGQFRCIVGANFYSSAAWVTCKNGYVLA